MAVEKCAIQFKVSDGNCMYIMEGCHPKLADLMNIRQGVIDTCTAIPDHIELANWCHTIKLQNIDNQLILINKNLPMK